METFTCNQCARSFSRRENLTRHQQTHKNVLPHRCSQCSKTFSRADLLRKHQKSVHEKHGRRKVVARSSIPPSVVSNDNDPIEQHHIPRVTASQNRPDTSVVGTFYQGPSPFDHDEQTAAMATDFGSSLIDFSTFALPWDNTMTSPDDLFTSNFYDVLHETADEWQGSLGILLEDFNDSVHASNGDLRPAGGLAHIDPQDIPEGDLPVSRMNSPPNEPSAEDSYAFAYDPRSTRLSQTAVRLSNDDPWVLRHQSIHDISHGSWNRLQAFLAPIQEERSWTLRLPSYRDANVFISIFMLKFLPQAPVLHLPTCNLNEFPPVLLTAMMAIGAIYSSRRHTARFAILVLERAQINLQYAVSTDLFLSRDPMIIFSVALICHAGLWCGNKRSFEMAEALRGSLVTYIRRMPSSRGQIDPPGESQPNDHRARWLMWSVEETKRRLCWYAFMIDGQFPCLNMKPMFSLAEASKWYVPCDGRFWLAPNHRVWQKLLGLSSQPPSLLFSTAIASVLGGLPAVESASTNNALHAHLNSWGAFIVLLALTGRALEWSHDWQLEMDVVSDGLEDMNDTDFMPADTEMPSKSLQMRRKEIRASLATWYNTYGSAPGLHNKLQKDVSFFDQACLSTFEFTQMILVVPITHLQDMLGKDGNAGIHRAKRTFISYFSSSFRYILSAEEPLDRVLIDLAIDTALSVSRIKERTSDGIAIPYDIITMFLGHVWLWVFALSAPTPAKQEFIERTSAISGLDHILDCGTFGIIADLPLATPSHRRTNAILRHAAQNLCACGPWGVSLNLALLLHRRSGMEVP